MKVEFKDILRANEQEVAQKPYSLNASELKMKSADNAKQVRVKE